MPRVLHIGCATSHIRHSLFEDYDEVRLDLYPSATVGVVGDAKALPFADKSFDGVQSFHVMEHLHADDFPRAMAEAYRVLDDDGILAFIVPDFETVCQWILDGKEDEPLYHAPIGHVYAVDVFYGHRGLTRRNPGMAHRNGLTPKRIARDMKAAGFVDIQLTRLGGRFEIEAIGKRN
jgi:ubiquinone/menaquinone biosynthesis C-methylase UbiE